MRSPDAIYRAAASGAALFLLAAGSGCTGLAPRFRSPASPTLTHAAPTTPVAEPSTENEQSYQQRLASIEEFLERTRDYQAAPAEGVETANPSTLERYITESNGRTGVAGGDPDAVESGRVGTSGLRALGAMPAAPPAPALPVLRSVSVRTAPPIAPAMEPAPARGTNVAMEVETNHQPPMWEAMLAHFRERAQRVRDFDAVWRLGLLELALGLDTRPMEMAADVPPQTVDLIRTLLQVVGAVRDAAMNPLEGGAVALTYVDDLRNRLIDRSDPTITATALCGRVTTFGVYDEMTPGDFVAGRSTQAIVYAEIRGLSAEVSDDDRFETRLATQLEILTGDGRSMWAREEPQITDRCRRRRSDFFIAQRITLPATLPAGDYVMKVRVEDRISGRTNEALHPFSVSSTLSMANDR